MVNNIYIFHAFYKYYFVRIKSVEITKKAIKMKIQYYNFINTATDILETINENVIKSENFKEDLKNTKIYVRNKLLKIWREKFEKNGVKRNSLHFSLDERGY